MNAQTAALLADMRKTSTTRHKLVRREDAEYSLCLCGRTIRQDKIARHLGSR